ncbi:MAG TPA: ATP-binding cassette domain-containing protein, partial [Aeromicrobium sp.]|nr:ATP-binding cassette domain-containing protein [Aeromicrobium sp.]
MALLEVDDISVHYGRIQAIEGITLSVDEGEVVSLIGANGAGKTTTMRAIAGLLSLSHGSVKFA